MLELKQIEVFYPDNLKPFKRNILREYLQYKILEIIYSSKFASSLNFMGGTAIHIAYQLPRFSEDLDFDNTGMDKKGFAGLAALIEKKLKLQGLTVDIKTTFKAAFRAYIRIPRLLYECGLSSHEEERILIQIDTEPQKFEYKPDEIILNKFDIFTRIGVVPADVLLSQKIYAILMRRRPMGRDFFDAIHLFGRTKPNYIYLEEKIKIDGLQALKDKLLKHCQKLNFQLLAKDVEGFLFEPDQAQKIELFCEYIKGLK